MRTKIAALVVLAALSACERHSSGVTAAGAPSGSATPGPVPADVSLATSRSTRAVPADARVVVLSRTRLAIDRDGATLAVPDPASWAQGFEAKYKRDARADYFVLPLGNAMAGTYPGDAGVPELAVAVDASVPYRLLVETLYTLGQERASRISLMVRSAMAPASIALTMPGHGDHLATKPQVDALLSAVRSDAGVSRKPAASALPETEAGVAGHLDLNVIFVSDGFIVSGAGHRMAPGCREVGMGTAVPMQAGASDLAGLTACVTRLKASAPAFATETRVTLVAAASTATQALVATMDALRGTDSPLFPDVMLGVPSR